MWVLQATSLNIHLTSSFLWTLMLHNSRMSWAAPCGCQACCSVGDSSTTKHSINHFTPVRNKWKGKKVNEYKCITWIQNIHEGQLESKKLFNICLCSIFVTLQWPCMTVYLLCIFVSPLECSGWEFQSPSVDRRQQLVLICMPLTTKLVLLSFTGNKFNLDTNKLPE